MGDPTRLRIDQNGFVRADGPVVGRRVVDENGCILLEIKDRNRRRCDDLGRRYVYISMDDLRKVMNE